MVQPPEDYKPIRMPGKRFMSGTSPFESTPMYYQLPGATDPNKHLEVPGTPLTGPNALPNIKPEDIGYFGALLQPVDEKEMSLQEQKERKIMMLLLKVKNGTPPMRKSSLRQITEKARDFGAAALFNQILPLLMSPTLED
jgi:splicing factor 3B subunit 1